MRVVDRNNNPIWPERPADEPSLGPPISGVTDIGALRVTSRELVVRTPTPSEAFGGRSALVTTPVGYVQYAKPERIDHHARSTGCGSSWPSASSAARCSPSSAASWSPQRAMRPIAGLTRAAREVARTRDPDITLPKPQANDEVAELAHTFEDMLRELGAAREETEETLARQRKFVADASHELRTPLTSILANLELLEAELAGEQRDMADSALRSSRRMRRLVGDLLLLARADAGRDVPRGPVDLAAVARRGRARGGRALLRPPGRPSTCPAP